MRIGVRPSGAEGRPPGAACARGGPPPCRARAARCRGSRPAVSSAPRAGRRSPESCDRPPAAPARSPPRRAPTPWPRRAQRGRTGAPPSTRGFCSRPRRSPPRTRRSTRNRGRRRAAGLRTGRQKANRSLPNISGTPEESAADPFSYLYPHSILLRAKKRRARCHRGPYVQAPGQPFAAAVYFPAVLR